MPDSNDLRDFIREMSVRGERQTSAMVATLDRQTSVLVDLQGEIADQRRQIQASTDALLSVLDRLD